MREVEARLKISAIDRTGNVLSRVGKQMSEVNRRAAALNRQQSLLAKSTMAMYSALARFAAPAALAYGVKEALTSFAEMDRRMTRIGITADASAEQTSEAFATLQRQAKDMAMPLDQAVKGLDTLVSSGLSLKDAMDFLPSVLATAQASGAETQDIANTAIKAASALKLQAGEMQRAFDIMVAGGKAGQFELKDMAQYIPDLANSFATLGYTGEDGLKKLVAMMQTVREDTGSSEAAATNLQNIFGKIYSEDTAGKFKKMGIDLNAELAKAKKNGEDTVAAFVRISNEAVKGDLTKLPKLFTDQQFRLGMQSLMTSADSYSKFLATVNDTKVNGTVFRDLKKVTDDTQASIDRLSSSWDNFMRSIGKQASGVLAPAMDRVTKMLSDRDALNAGNERLGGDSDLINNQRNEFLRRAREMGLTKTLHQGLNAWDNAVRALGRGEVDSPLDWVSRESMRWDTTGKLRQNYGLYRRGNGPANLLAADAKKGTVPTPVFRPGETEMARDRLRDAYRYGTGREYAGPIARQYAGESALNRFYGTETTPEQAIQHASRMKARFPERYREVVNPDALGGPAGFDQTMRELSSITTTFEDGSQKLADGGSEAGQKLIQAAQEAGRVLNAAISQAAAALSNIKVNASVSAPRVNADTGKTNGFVNSPANVYRGPK